MTTPEWQKSSFSGGGEGNNCIELAPAPGNRTRLRESDTPADELTLDTDRLTHLLDAVKDGRAPELVDVTFSPDGELVHLDATVTTTRAKWNAFVRGVRAGEFDQFVGGTPAERELGRSYSTGKGDGAVRFEVEGLDVECRADRTALLTYRLTVARPELAPERWEFTLHWDDKSFADVLTSSDPEPERLRQLVHLVRSLMDEWWATKGHNRRSAKMGRRLS
ncbi:MULTISPECIES: DUF397 domain-containing protein [unclassified Streptomyces]|uniref:DUF397 domain-containing protein n=1 Tax=unclassified Streptomyces TaxID=2593676 RepID=UPI00278C6C3A|nr:MULTISPECIES: DUF397 domain-containing protein [unclassified Streptomyces]